MLRDDSLKRLKKGQQDSLRGLIRPDSIERENRNLMPKYDEFRISGISGLKDDNNDMFSPEDKLQTIDSQIMNREQHNTGLKQGFFSMIDNVLGGG
jgi:hypothetical protein|tara:strand:+ start:634 stop:921 length:288 start_codon:yes stop_codon:yes gene_type:complete